MLMTSDLNHSSSLLTTKRASLTSCLSPPWSSMIFSFMFLLYHNKNIHTRIKCVILFILGVQWYSAHSHCCTVDFYFLIFYCSHSPLFPLPISGKRLPCSLPHLLIRFLVWQTTEKQKLIWKVCQRSGYNFYPQSVKEITRSLWCIRKKFITANHFKIAVIIIQLSLTYFIILNILLEQ